MEVKRVAQHESRAREAQARAEVAALAIGEAGKTDDLAEKRKRLMLARLQLRKSLHRLEEDLLRISAA